MSRQQLNGVKQSESAEMRMKDCFVSVCLLKKNAIIVTEQCIYTKKAKFLLELLQFNVVLPSAVLNK